MKLYVAYGSNLNKRAMRMRCPSARPIGKIYLSNARLVFRGVADVEIHKGNDNIVPCGLWIISKQDEDALDRYEGVQHGSYERWWIPVTYRGRKRKALIYVMRDRRGIDKPSQLYADTIFKGYADFGFTKKDRQILWDAIDRSHFKKPTDQTRARRERRKKDPKHRKLVSMSKRVLANLARHHIEKYIGDVAADYKNGEMSKDEYKEEAYCLGFDALINSGVDDREAAEVAKMVARSYVS